MQKINVSEESSWTPPLQNSEEKRSPQSDSEPEQRPILPTENQRNRKMQLGSTEQDDARQLLESARTVKSPQKGTYKQKIKLFYFVIDFEKKKKLRCVDVI